MKMRMLGKTGLKVSEIGLGAWQLANTQWGMDGCDEEEAVRIVAAAIECGCNFFDTAPGYSLGNSERLLGKALGEGGKRDAAVLCTKFGHDATGKTDWSAGALRPSVEASLTRLRTDRLDVLLLHNPKREILEGDQGAELRGECEKLRQEGKLVSYGASVDSSRELERIINWPGAMAAEILFNCFHQEPRLAFARAEARGVGLIVKVPLDSGFLSGKYDAVSKFAGVRERWSAEIVAKRGRLIEKLKGMLPVGMTMSEMALKFVLAHGEVSTVIPGGKSVEQVRENCRASGQRLDAATVAAIRALWEKELATEPLPW
ncbi:MAG: aldo/keto reductase [Phycisphaerales bacterium]|nr:aldo/keto reductase [Phycisphaerales bacterium]